jgi:membrane protein implicated in regulation of membrane protease activity
VSESLIWAIVGIVLIIAEVLSTSFVLVFFGVGALVVALLVQIGVLSGLNGPLLVFCATSLVLLVLMRRFLRNRFAGRKDMKPDYIDQVVGVVKEIRPGEEGAVSYRGSEWIAFGDGIDPIPAGEKVRVRGIDGIRLKVERIARVADAKGGE